MIDLKKVESAQQSAQRFNEAITKASHVSFEMGYTDGFADGYKQGQKDAQPEIIRCHQCGFWDRETLRHQFNDFRDWNEAECLILAERDAYDEINRYTEADDYCSRAERRKQ